MKSSHAASVAAAMLVAVSSPGMAQRADDFYDSHFHITNYIQRGPDPQFVLKLMGTRVGRSTLFGIPLQQTWNHANSGNYAPSYYLDTDEALYYYSFTDAWIAMQYRALPPAAQARFEPMITGFNPADMYAVDHIRRVLTTFPGVFSGIGEFSIHKEFVSSKVGGDVATLTNPALDSILAFAAEAGLVVVLHNDIDRPFARPNEEPIYLKQVKDVLRRHPRSTIIWAHMGLGRVVHPTQRGTGRGGNPDTDKNQIGIIEAFLEDPALRHVSFDISWDEVAKYVVASPQSVQAAARVVNRFPHRFLFGTDNMAPTDSAGYYAVFEMYRPLWNALTPEASEKVRRGNFARLFDRARIKVREWETAHRPGTR